ncbi:MAG: PAS domain-containing sensor histidine kinase [Anaerolineae bacterium]
MTAGSSITGASTVPANDLANVSSLLDDVLSSPFDPVLVLDPVGRILACNQGAEALFGPEVNRGVAAASVPAVALMFAQLEVSETLPVWGALDGRSYLVQQSSTPAGHTLLVLRDVTDWKQLSLRLADLMHIVSHDLRTPLTAIKSYADMLVDSYFGEMSREQQAALEKLTLGIYGMVSLVDNLQAADRFDPHKGLYKTEREPIDVRETVQKVLDALQLPAEIQDIALETDVDPAVPIIRADPLMLERALANLVENALKYSSGGTRVLIRITSDGDAVLFAVSDQGRGIAPEDHVRIFERGVRIEQSGQKRVRGSGLGLFVVQSVAQRHGGTVWVESTLGQGSTFYLRLPVRGESAGA